MGEVLFATYNSQDYERFSIGEREDARTRQTEEWRYRLFEEMVRTIMRTTSATEQPGVIAIQELPGDKPQRSAGHALAGLAEATGMQCMVRKSRGPGDPGVYAVQPGNNANLAVGLMWSKDLKPLEDSWMGFNQGFWHSLAAVALDVGAKQPVLHASAHQPPYRGGHSRAPEAKQIASLLRRQTTTPHIVLGIDQNSLGEDPVYDPMPDLPHFSPEEIIRRHAAKREAAATFTASGLIDAVYWLNKGRYLAQSEQHDEHGRPLEELRAVPTTGHYIVPEYGMADYGARRIDLVRVTKGVLPALTGHNVPSDIPRIQEASDHLPQIVSYDPQLLS